MIYQSHLKKLTRVQNKTFNSHRLTNVPFVKEVVLNQDIQLIGVVIVVEMEKLDLTKVFSQSSKHVLNVLVVERKLQTHVTIVVEVVINKFLKKYL